MFTEDYSGDFRGARRERWEAYQKAHASVHEAGVMNPSLHGRWRAVWFSVVPEGDRSRRRLSEMVISPFPLRRNVCGYPAAQKLRIKEKIAKVQNI
jgi:hypothetical protein